MLFKVCNNNLILTWAPIHECWKVAQPHLCDSVELRENMLNSSRIYLINRNLMNEPLDWNYAWMQSRKNPI